MALLDFDGWGYANTADIALYGWNNTGGTVSAASGRRGGPALQYQGTAAIYRAFTAAASTITFGFWIKPNAVGVDNLAGIALVFDVDSTKHLSITGRANGALEFHRGNWTDTVYASTAAGVMATLVGVWLEVELLVHGSSGTLKVWANDVLLVSYIGNTSGGGTGVPGIFQFGGAFNHYGTCDVSDFYLLDASGASLNARLGSGVRVDSQPPTANGATGDSTPSSGSNRAAMVDEVGSNGDTDYNTLAAAGNQDTLELTNLIASGSQILAVQTRIVAKRTGSATNIAPVLRIGGADYVGSGQALSTSYAGYRQIDTVSPGSAISFIETEFNAMEGGYRTSANAARVTQFTVETLTTQPTALVGCLVAGESGRVGATNAVLFALSGDPESNDVAHSFKVVAPGGIVLDGPLTISGLVSGPVSSTDNAIARWNGTAGDAIQNSTPTVEDDGRIANVTDPSGAQDAATKNYVDGIAVNLGKRATVRVATTANVTISTALNNGDSLDGVTLATGDMVLVKSQTAPAENGVYVVAASPARASQFDTYNEHPGSLIAVQEGTANADTLWLCTSNVGGTLNTTSIAFSAVSITSGITQLTGDVTAGPGSGSQAATIPNSTVTYAKMQAVSAASRLLGRGSAGGSGVVQELSLGTGLSLSGATLSATSTGSEWSVLTNGDPTTPELIFDSNGDVIMVETLR